MIFSSAPASTTSLADPDLPRGVPIVRMATEETAQTMGEYVCLAALSILRDGNRLAAAQADRALGLVRAAAHGARQAGRRQGLGNIGQVAARMLRGLGFSVAGWARTPRELDGIKVYSGESGLDDFLRRERHPRRTAAGHRRTRGLLDRKRIRRLPRGAGSSMPGAARSS